MSIARPTSWNSQEILLNAKEINQAIQTIARQIKTTFKNLPHPKVVKVVDMTPTNPYFTCELTRKLIHVSKKKTLTAEQLETNFALHSMESYIQFDENDQPIITKASFKDAMGSTIILAAAIANTTRVNNLLKHLADIGVKEVYLASLFNMTGECTPNFYAYDCSLPAQALVGYSMERDPHLQNKPQIKTDNANGKQLLTQNSFARNKPLLSQETTYTIDALKDIEDGLADLSKVLELYSKDTVKSKIDAMVDHELVPFLVKLGKLNKPIVACIMKNGGTHFASYVLRRIGQYADMPAITISIIHGSRYGKNHVGGDMQWFTTPKNDFKDCTVLHFEDVLEGGKTMKLAQALINSNDQHIVSFGDKPDCRMSDCKEMKPTFTVFTFQPNQFVGGIGLDYSGLGRSDFCLTYLNLFADKEKDTAEKALEVVQTASCTK